jgi:hypothetical protein
MAKALMAFAMFSQFAFAIGESLAIRGSSGQWYQGKPEILPASTRRPGLLRLRAGAARLYPLADRPVLTRIHCDHRLQSCPCKGSI